MMDPGGDILPAFQWFMKGRWGQQQRDNGGFFEALFADQEQIARFVSTNPTTFPAELYKGLKNKESVIGIVRQDRGFLHSASIWGAEFANDGTISALYITDSNDRENEDDVREYDKYKDRYQTKAGMIRQPVKVINNMYYVPNSQGKYIYPITQSYFFGLYQDKFDAYLKSIGK